MTSDQPSLSDDLCHAIQRGELMLHYQPKVSFQSESIIGVEVLLRWQHPAHGLMMPDQFMPMAEQVGLIKPLVEWVIGAALRQAHAWHRRGLDLAVAVNLSMLNVLDPQLPLVVAELLKGTRVEPYILQLELTESAIMADPDLAMSMLSRLRDFGVRASIDDFGTGYSSLVCLERLQVDEIKVDLSFVRGMATDASKAVIVKTAIAMAHSLGLAVVAEGVEDQHTWNLLQALECDVAQGFYISRALPADDFVEWQANSRWTLARSERLTAFH